MGQMYYITVLLQVGCLMFTFLQISLAPFLKHGMTEVQLIKPLVVWPTYLWVLPLDLYVLSKVRYAYKVMSDYNSGGSGGEIGGLGTCFIAQMTKQIHPSIRSSLIINLLYGWIEGAAANRKMWTYLSTATF